MTASTPPLHPPAANAAPGGASADEGIDESLLDELSPVELEALRWSVRVSDGLTDEAREALQTWMDADPAHREAYEDMAGVWDAVAQIPPAGHARLSTIVAIDAAATSSAHKLTREAPGAEGDGPKSQAPFSAQPRRGLTHRFALHALAGAAALGVLGSAWLGWEHWQSQPVFSRHYASERGQSLDVSLPDGSGLVLDTATQADVTLYRHHREVRMPEGQVLFQVQADKARPFDVLAGAARITVVGTRFSVRYTPSSGDAAVQVAVIEGRVRVASNARGSGIAKTPGSESVEITAGQLISADAQGHLSAVGEVSPDAIATWRGHRLNFDSVPLAEVLAEISRYGDIRVSLADAEVGRLLVTASVDLRKLDAFVRTLPQVMPVRLVRHDGELRIEATRR